MRVDDDDDGPFVNRPAGLCWPLARLCLCGRSWTSVANKLNTQRTWSHLIAPRSALLILITLAVDPLTLAAASAVLLPRLFLETSRDQVFWNVVGDVALASVRAVRWGAAGKAAVVAFATTAPLFTPLCVFGIVAVDDAAAETLSLLVVLLVAVARGVTARPSVFDPALLAALWFTS